VFWVGLGISEGLSQSPSSELGIAGGRKGHALSPRAVTGPRSRNSGVWGKIRSTFIVKKGEVQFDGLFGASLVV